MSSPELQESKKAINEEVIKILKRIPIYFFGIFLMGLGINLSKLAGLGITPVSSIPYAIELITGMKLGTVTIYMNLVFIALQVAILGREFKLRSFLQFFCAFFIGISINISAPDSIFLYMIPTPETYLYKLILCAISCLVCGMGIYTYVSAKLIPIPGEGLILSIVEKSRGKLEFHKVKITSDVIMVIISASLSLIFLGSLKSVREGTIIAALLVGVAVGWCKRIHDKILSFRK